DRARHCAGCPFRGRPRRLRGIARQPPRQRLQVVSRAGTGERCDRRARRGGLTLTVEDDGPGISEENRSKIMERGVRTDETVPGHGLGLAMVHDTVDLYGGTLVVDASPIGG